MSNYQHSSAFSCLKEVKEKIETNFTSHQYLTTLDALLNKGLDLLYLNTPDFALSYYSKVLARQTLKPSIKYTRNEEKYCLPTLFANFLLSRDLKYLHDLNFNRGILFGLLSHFLNVVNIYTCKHTKAMSTNAEALLEYEVRTKLGLDLLDEVNLYEISLEVEYWYNQALAFKEVIIQKYTRMALMQAKSTYTELSHSLPLDDIAQIYLMYVSKSIDRCDSRQGVLTTFIQSWLKSAKSESALLARENYNLSYDSMLDDEVFVEGLGTHYPDPSYEELQHLAYVVKKHDKQGYIRACHGIPEYLSIHQKKFLLFFKKEGD